MSGGHGKLRIVPGGAWDEAMRRRFPDLWGGRHVPPEPEEPAASPDLACEWERREKGVRQ